MIINKTNLTMLYQEHIGGLSITELAIKYSLHKSVIYTGFQALELEVNLTQVDKRRKISVDDEAYILESYQGGTTLQTLGKKFGVSHQTISKVLKKHNIEVRKAGFSKLTKKL